MKETKGKVVVDRIDKKLAEIGMYRTALTDIVGRAQNTLNNWASRDTSPPADVALKIADVLGCSVRWLITGELDKAEEFSQEERNIINRYRNLDRQGKFEVKALLEAKATPVGKESIPEIISAVEKKQNAG